MLVTGRKSIFLLSSSKVSMEILLSKPLLPDFKIFDFFSCCEGEELTASDSFLKTELKELMYVRAFKGIDFDDIKNIQALSLMNE